MIDEQHRDKRPFKVGQLIKHREWSEDGLSLVLDIEWDFDISSWSCIAYSQRTGRKTIIWSHSYVVAEKSK
jgi:heat shock protein HspQ